MGKHFNALADKLKALHTSKLDFKYHFNLTYEMKKYLEFARNSRFWFDELKKGLEPFYYYLEKVKNINQNILTLSLPLRMGGGSKYISKR